jgi:hypothetical protein
MLLAAAILLKLSVGQSLFDLNYPFKENEEVVIQQRMKVTIGERPIRYEHKSLHKCVYINDSGVQTIETEILEGFIDKDGEKEDLKGDTGGYFRNSFGESFDYEEVRPTLKEDPFNFVQDEIMSTHKRRSVQPGDTWTAESAHTRYKVTVGQVAKVNGHPCIKITRDGVFTKGLTGSYLSEGWFRANGLLQSMVVKAKNLGPEGYGQLDFEMTLSLIKPE